MRIARALRLGAFWRHILLLCALAGAAAIGFLASGIIKPNQRYSLSREKAIFSQASQQSFGALLLGDSFVELAYLPELCGYQALNAGVSGAKAADVERIALPLIRKVRPRVVLINVGANDAHRTVMTAQDDVAASIRTVVLASKVSGARVIMLAPALPLSASSYGFDSAQIARIVGAERHLGATIVPPLESQDGVHPNAAGYVVWKRLAASGCA